jgi:quercetin dioxygenase-like cupin family protein
VSADVGGDPPCWAHLLDSDGECDGGEPTAPPTTVATVVDLGATDTRGRSGVVWSLPHGGDLDANLVHLGPGAVIEAHHNDEVDVVISVLAGRGRLTVDDAAHLLRGDVLALIPKGSRREVRAGSDGITYLSLHRRRDPVSTLRRRTDTPTTSSTP